MAWVNIPVSRPAIRHPISGLYFVGGTLVMDKPSVRLTCAMLENAEHGLSLVSCANELLSRLSARIGQVVQPR